MSSTPQQKLMYLQRKYPGILENAQNMGKKEFAQKYNISLPYVRVLAAMFQRLFPEKNFMLCRAQKKEQKKGEENPGALHKSNIENKYPGIMTAMTQMTNTDVAKKYEISRERVRQFRLRFSIPAPESKFVWTEERIQLLGKQSDLALGRQWNVPSRVVQYKRQRLCIPAYTAKERYVKLLPFEDLIGRLSDRKIAKMAAVHPQTVADVRKEKGIPPHYLSPMCKDFQPVDLKEVERLVLAGASDAEIAAKMNRTEGSIQNIRSQKLRLLRRPGTGEPYRLLASD